MTANPNTPGIGLRLAHLAEMVATRPLAGWLEVHPENFLSNPHAAELLTELSAHYPISLHTVGISVGSANGFDHSHLKRICVLADRLDPVFVSGHLAWSTHDDEYLNDLLPLPYNKETLQLVATHIDQVQDGLGRPYLIENPASYVGFRSSTMKETDFLSEIARRTGCQLLCDVSNVVVSAHNMGYHAYQYIDDFPVDAIREIHLGGYTPEEDEAIPGAELWIDTHAAAITEPSWHLYAYALRRFGPKPTLIEWDNEIPPLTTLLGEAAHAGEIAQAIVMAGGDGPMPNQEGGEAVYRNGLAARSVSPIERSRKQRPELRCRRRTMPRLAEIQSYFRKAVVDDDTSSVATMLTGGDNPARRLTIHQRNYRTSLVDALLVKFPATGWLIGTPFLTEAAERFVREHPPQAPCIAEYGVVFPDFLAQCPGAERLPYLREFAQLEWYVGRVSIAVDRAPVDNGKFSSIDAAALPDTVLTLQSGLCYLRASWPVDELMKLYLTESAPEQFDLSRAELGIEVCGARGKFHLNRLDTAEFIFRKSVWEGLSIGDAAECALDVNPGFDPGRALASLIVAGLITGITPDLKEKTRDHF